MPLFEVTERRCYEEITIIEARDQQAAQNNEGTVMEVYQTDSWADALVMARQISDA